MTSTPSTRRPLDGVAMWSIAAHFQPTRPSSPRYDFSKNYRVHPTHWLISTQVPLDEILVLQRPVREVVSDAASSQRNRIVMVQKNFGSYPLDHKEEEGPEAGPEEESERSW